MPIPEKFNDDDDVQAAAAVTKSAKLSPTEHELLIDFVIEAVDAGYAARFILKMIDDDHGMSREEIFIRFKQTLKKLLTKFSQVAKVPTNAHALVQHRDGQRSSTTERKEKSTKSCCELAHVIPPTIFMDDDMDPQGELFPIMEAFLTASKISELRTLLHGTTDQYILRNLWTLSPSIHSAFRNGHVKLQPFTANFFWADKDELENSSKSEIRNAAASFLVTAPPLEDPNNVTVHTSDPLVYKLPSPMLLRVHYRIASLLHHYYVEDRIAEGWPRQPRLTYELPFGLILKKCRAGDENEANVLKIVEKHTGIPAPLFVDSFRDEAGHLSLVMTAVRGRRLNEVYHRMSYEERDQFVDDMKRYVAQLRSLPAIFNFANTVGGPIRDHRISGRGCGPYKTEAEFHECLVSPLGGYEEPEIAYAHSLEHKRFFTHADLHPTNILMEGGRVSGVIDWESAGYYPEYWEFTKAMYGVLIRDGRDDMWRRVFGHRYEAELKAEQILWRQSPLGL